MLTHCLRRAFITLRATKSDMLWALKKLFALMTFFYEVAMDELKCCVSERRPPASGAVGLRYCSECSQQRGPRGPS